MGVYVSRDTHTRHTHTHTHTVHTRHSLGTRHTVFYSIPYNMYVHAHKRYCNKTLPVTYSTYSAYSTHSTYSELVILMKVDIRSSQSGEMFPSGKYLSGRCVHGADVPG